MGNVLHTKRFDRVAYRATVNTMRERGEDVHDAGKKHRDETGGLHPNVDIVGKKPRGSHNAMVPGDRPGIFVLPNGISLPVLSMFDGTASTYQYVGDFFRTAERQDKLFDGVRTRYNPQLATGVVNDVFNVGNNDLPVVQVSQFEGDERAPEQVRLLLPASMGNDTTAEDYDLGLWYPTLIYADIWTFYGLKGYLTLALDEIGRGYVTGEGVRRYLGQSADFDRLGTDDICRQLLDQWHLFIIQVPTSTGRFARYTHPWWVERVGRSRVIQLEDPRLLADVRAALIYVSEARTPSLQGFTEFLRTGDQVAIDAAHLNQVWRVIQPAQEHFGAQSQLPGYYDIPLPGDTFEHYRHAWPIGSRRASENVTPIEEAVS